MIYVYAKANQMINHRFTDDVAIVRTYSKKRAFKYFFKLYGNCTIDDIERISFLPRRCRDKVRVLTDY